MLKIEGITNDPDQNRTVTLTDESSFSLRLRFLPFQSTWKMDVQYQDFSLMGITVINHYNLLRPFMNFIPFGISCLTRDIREPSFLEDFSSGHSEMFLLIEDEVREIEGNISV